jgi:hypothetical protein
VSFDAISKAERQELCEVPALLKNVMPRWRVDYLGKGGKHLGTVDAPDERTAIAEAAQMFDAMSFDVAEPM